MKELNQTVNKTVITNTRFFKMFTNASHIKKEEQIMATITITIEIMGIITSTIIGIMINLKTILDARTYTILTEINS